MKEKIHRFQKLKWKKTLYDMRLSLLMFFVMLVLTVIGISLLKRTLLQNADDTGNALARNYAAEERSNLKVYDTLINFAVSSLEEDVRENTISDVERWMMIYFHRVEDVLGKDMVNPYMVYQGRIVAANPWEGEDSYNYEETEWYQKAIAAEGETIFTDVYTDVVTGQPVVTAAKWNELAEVVVCMDINLQNFHLQFDLMELEEKESFVICDSAGKLVFKQSNADKSDEEWQRYLTDILSEIKAGRLDDYDSYIIDPSGVKRGIYYSQMENGWYSIVTIPYQIILETYTILSVVLVLSLCLALIIFWGTSLRTMQINERMERTNDTVRVLGNSYFALYRINYRENTYEMIKGSDYVRSRIPPSGSYDTLLTTISDIIEEETYKEFSESFSTEKIQSLVARRVRDYGGEFLRRFGDEYRWVSVRVLYDESLSPGEVVLCLRKVDDEKRRQLQERKLLQDALEVSRRNETAKQAFFSNMSHDLRTPLNAVIGLSSLAIRDVEDPQKVEAYLQKINSSSRQMLRLINDILDMSRMEQGKVVLNQQNFNLRECIMEDVENFRTVAEEQEKEFQVNLKLQDVYVQGDAFRIHQILNNLLSNAFKFTDEDGKISLSVTQLDRSEYAKYKFVVEDNGLGMSEEYLPHLFEPYTREIRFGVRQTAGTGLGMPITKNLVSQMDGEIYVESHQGEGTRFTIILPFTRAQETDEEETQKKTAETDFSLEGSHILLAEDNEINMEITTEILSMHKVSVTQAWNGAEALQIFRDAAQGSFDAILMDMQMPVMDGCEAAKRIRALDRADAKTIPILAVTANVFAEDVAATTVAGMNAHISKPVNFEMLCKTLSGLMEKQKEGENLHAAD